MLKNVMAKSFIYLFLGGMLFSFNSSYAARYASSYNDTAAPRQYASGREEVAQVDNPNVRMGNWDYKENWRYQRTAFFNGETQSKAYRDEHPYGPKGIGYDGDEDYMRRRQNNESDNYSNGSSYDNNSYYNSAPQNRYPSYQGTYPNNY